MVINRVERVGVPAGVIVRRIRRDGHVWHVTRMHNNGGLSVVRTREAARGALNQAALVPLVLRSVYIGDRRMRPSDIPASPPKRDRFLPCGDPAWSNGADAAAAQQRLAEATVPNPFKNHEARKRISLCSPYFIFPTCQARAFQEVHSAPQLDRPKIRPYAWWLIRCHARSLK